MTKYPFYLDKSGKKYICPSCGKKRFVRFKDSITHELVADQFGRCDREDNCGYFEYPKKEKEFLPYFYRGGIAKSFQFKQKVNDQKYIPWEVLQKTLIGYDECSFFDYLIRKDVPESLIEEVISMYYLGTIQEGYLKGALTIPFITIDNKVAFVQVKNFDENNSTLGNASSLHSILKSVPGNDWVKEYETNDKKVICFFGVHLLKKYPKNPIALVEAPKTAIYGALYFGLPKNDSDLIWLAVYNKSSLTEDKFKDLIGRKVILFPDLSNDSNTFNSWKDKAKTLGKLVKRIQISISTFLEENAPDDLKLKGGDLADYISQFSWNDFNKEHKSVKSVENEDDKKTYFKDDKKEVVKFNENNITSVNILKCIEVHKSYSAEELFQLIITSFDLSSLEASNQMQLLIDKQLIYKTSINNYYYRSDSTPF